MIETAAPPKTQPPGRSVTLTLVGIVVVFIVFNSVSTWFAPDDDGFLAPILLGAFIMQPILFGAWSALGTGSMLTRLPLVVPCLMLLFAAPGYIPASFADVRRNEFYTIVAAGFAIYVVATILFLVFRRLSRMRLCVRTEEPLEKERRLRFSMAYLFALTTLCAVAIGLTTQLKLQPQPRAGDFFGPDFYTTILIYGSAILASLTFTTVVLPLAILYGYISRRALIAAVLLWAIISLPLAILLGGDTEFAKGLGFVLLAQVGAAFTGTAVAMALRRAGLHLLRYT